MIPHFRYNRTFDIPLNHDQCRQYVSDIVELKRDKLSLVEKVERLTKFCESAAFFCRPDFVQARGVRYLVEVATSPGSDVDAVAEVSEETHHSMRRVAVGTLAEQANYWPYIEEMKTAGLFERLPRMLAAIGPVYRHGQSFQQMCGWGRFTDQRQFLYERLVGICAGAAMYSSELGAELLEACADALFQHFHATASAAASLTVESYLDCDPLPDTLLRFVAHALPGASDALVERLLDAGAEQKLRACRVAGETQRQAVLQRLDLVYERRQARMKAQAEARAAAEQSAGSAKLRHAGNKAFQRGRVEEAVRLYSEALALDPSDPVVHSNRSLCHLRLKNHAEAQWLLPSSTEYAARASEAAAALCGQQPWSAASIPDWGNPNGDAEVLGAWLGCDAVDARERLSLIRRGGDLQRGDERALAAAELGALLAQVRKRRGGAAEGTQLSNGHASGIEDVP